MDAFDALELQRAEQAYDEGLAAELAAGAYLEMGQPELAEQEAATARSCFMLAKAIGDGVVQRHELRQL